MVSSILTYPFLIYDKIANVHSNLVWRWCFRYALLVLIELLWWLLEKYGDLFEDSSRLFENPEHILEELSFLLENNQFIRTIFILLESSHHILEKNRAPILPIKKTT